MLLSNSILQFCPEILNWIKVKSVTIFARWHGTPSCINILQLSTAMCNSNFFINSRYFLPFMVVPGSRNNRPAIPWVEIAPQIITLSMCFMVCCVNLTLYRVPGDLLTVLFIKANCWIVVSSENKTLDHCWLVQSASTSTSLQGSVSVFYRFPWFEAEFVS